MQPLDLERLERRLLDRMQGDTNEMRSFLAQILDELSRTNLLIEKVLERIAVHQSLGTPLVLQTIQQGGANMKDSDVEAGKNLAGGNVTE